LSVTTGVAIENLVQGDGPSDERPLRLTDAPGADSASAFKWDLLLGQGLGTPAVV